jgi:hypothetical protein
VLLADQRIEIDARPAPSPAPVLEVVMLGHCPSPRGDTTPGAGAQWQRVAADASLLAEIASLGLGDETRRLQVLLTLADPATAAGVPAIDALPQPGDDDLKALYRLPIPVQSLGQFRVLFPFAFDAPTRYVSVLAGERAWLPMAVQDYFEGSTSITRDQLKLWVIRVPELPPDDTANPSVQAFLPQAQADLTQPGSLGAFERALLPRRAAVITLPDLERLQIPSQLPDVPRLRLVNPVPAFLPCATVLDDSHRERRSAHEIPEMPAPLAPGQVIAPIARTLARLRPDMSCLLALPLEADQHGERPMPSRACIDYLASFTTRGLDETTSRADTRASALRHVQLLYPYLRGPQRQLGSPSGLVAAMQALVAQREGPWRSIGERPLPGIFLPWPSLTQHEATALRLEPGVTVLMRRNGQCVIDDERLCVPCLPDVALRSLTRQQRAADHWYSAEVMRFMGWLRRELQQLGERLVFDADIDDPRPELALQAFFSRLYALGGLRGARPELAFRIAKRSEGESTLIFDIEIAPAFPLDLIRITFLQDRHAETIATRLEAIDG